MMSRMQQNLAQGNERMRQWTRCYKVQKKEAETVIAKADLIKQEAWRLTKEAKDSSKTAIEAAHAAREAAESLPKDEAEKAIKYATHAQDMANGLQNQARYVKRVAKLAGVVAMHAIQASEEAQKETKKAREIATKAVEQAAKNAEVLKEINAEAHKAADDAVSASSRSRTAVYAAKMAEVKIEEMKQMAARKKAARELEEAEATGDATGTSEATVLIAKRTFLS